MNKGAITRQSVLKAIAEYDELGREAFLSKYRYGRDRSRLIVHEGREYDAKAIAGVAHKWTQGRALSPTEFSGGREHAPSWLEPLGFPVKAMAASEFSELAFTHFLTKLITTTGNWTVSLDIPLGSGARADIIAESQDKVLIIEVKRVSPQTNIRIKDTANQVKHYGYLARTGRYRDRKQQLIVAIPGILASKSEEILTESGVEVWDGARIAQMSAIEGRLLDEASRFLAPEFFENPPRCEALDLAQKLRNIAAGRESWSAYQRLCRDIAEFLFCPPLQSPIWERRNDTDTNRRDFILPNYAEDGFWKFLREKYVADYVVVDAKNYTRGIEKLEIIQVATYLTNHGPGLFAIIMTRIDPQGSAVQAIKNEWTNNNKMIVTLTDSDIFQMLTNKSFGNDPSELIRQKIEDFRLGV